MKKVTLKWYGCEGGAVRKEGKGGELLNVERKERKTNTVLKKELLLQLQQKI